MGYKLLNRSWGKFMAFLEIFKDDNSWNEKNIIGFISFGIMTIYSIADLVTGIMNVNLPLHEYIYQSFLYLTLGAFGIAGLEKFSESEKTKQIHYHKSRNNFNDDCDVRETYPTRHKSYDDDCDHGYDRSMFNEP